jgi:hypothetical protein
MPATSSTKPCAPASTTFALRKASSNSGVRASERCAASTPWRKIVAGSATPAPALHLHRSREVREHGQDRSFARLTETLARVVGAGLDPIRDVGSRQHRHRTERIGDAEQKLGEDRPGIAARAVEAASATRVSVRPACSSGERRNAPSTACIVIARFRAGVAVGTGNTLILSRCSDTTATSGCPPRGCG